MEEKISIKRMNFEDTKKVYGYSDFIFEYLPFTGGTEVCILYEGYIDGANRVWHCPSELVVSKENLEKTMIIRARTLNLKKEGLT